MASSCRATLLFLFLLAIIAGAASANNHRRLDDTTPPPPPGVANSTTNGSSSTGCISYDALQADRVPCSVAGASYYNCRPSAVANPYNRGCSVITQCRS